MIDKPFSQSCENNKKAIAKQLLDHFKGYNSVLEIGSGTGQHAVYFAKKLHWLRWQTSDRLENHPGILAWIQSSPAQNLLTPIELDVANSQHWPKQKFDGVFTANTAHIMSWQQVEKLFAGVAQLLESGGLFVQYGPFNQDGRFTAESNQKFEKWLKSQAEHMGIRDITDLKRLANSNGLAFVKDVPMPANNMLLLWRRC